MGECHFREALLNQIWKNYDVPIPSEGLVEQLDMAARKANKTIKEIFIKESVDILVKESDQAGSNIFATTVRNRLIKQLEIFSVEINFNWVWNFSNELKCLTNWPGISLTDKELNLANELIRDINSDQDELMSFKVATKDLKNKQLKLILNHALAWS